MAKDAQQVIVQERNKILAPLIDGDMEAVTATRIVKELVQYIAEERTDAAESRLWDYECQQKKDLLWLSRITGKPDMFSDEMRWFWDNGTWGNI